MPNYEVELGDERDLPRIEPYLASVGGSIVGVILSTPYYGVAINYWVGGVWGSGGVDTTLDDRIVVSLASDTAAATLSTQARVTWVAPLQPTATYTTGVPNYNFNIGAISGAINIAFQRAGVPSLSESIPAGTIRTLTVRHGDMLTLLECVPSAGYTFDHWEMQRNILQNGQIITDPTLLTFTENPYSIDGVTPHNQWVAYDMWTNVNVIMVGPPPPIETVTPWSATLTPGNYRVTFPETVTIGLTSYRFKQYEDSSTNPVRTVTVPSTGTLSILATYEPTAPPVSPTIPLLIIGGVILYLLTRP